MKCNTCGSEIKINCDYKQGRCPHVAPMLTDYHFRFYNLMEFIKKMFTPKGDCDCGHKH